jgi:hypothetical protein
MICVSSGMMLGKHLQQNIKPCHDHRTTGDMRAKRKKRCGCDVQSSLRTKIELNYLAQGTI